MIRSEAVLAASDNYGNVIDDPELACNFATLFDKSEEDFTCQEINATECSATTYGLLTADPTLEPTQAPTASAAGLAIS